MNVKPGRNDPCPCGSGKKLKKCCHDKYGARLVAPINHANSPAPTPAELNHLVDLLNTRRYAELEKRARLLIEQFPVSGVVWKVLGVVLQMQGKDALHAMQKATEFLPEDAEAHYNFGIYLRDIGRLDDALVSYRRALEINPNFAEAHSDLGFVLHNIGQLENALASLRRAVEIKPDFAIAYNSLGIVQRDLRQFDDAVASYRKALLIKPDYVEAHYNMGNVLQQLDQLDEAVASYRQAVKIKPDFAQAHTNLGNALRGIGQLDNALASYRQSLEIKPDFAETHCNLGIALKELKQFDAALASFCQALAIKPDYAKAHFNMGNALQDLGQFEDAVTSYRRALEINPNFAEAHYNLGNALQELRQLEDAVASYRRALEINPNFAEVYSNASVSRADYPHETIAHVTLGNVLMDAGDLSAAEKHFNIALGLDPEQAEAHQGLACLFQRYGNEKKSVFHRDMGYGKQPLSTLAHCGQGNPIQLLVLGSALVGNIPWRFLVDRKVFQTTLMSIEYFDNQLPLPAHQLILNVIGDADICQTGLEIATHLIEKTQAPIINRPNAVLQTGRLTNAKRLGAIPGVVSPRMVLSSKDDFYSGHALKMLEHEGIAFPFLLRPPGFHGGDYFVYVDNQDALNSAFAELPGESLLAIEFLDSQSADNLFRKYRVMSINGSFYPLHMAISTQWKVHYFSSDMGKNEKYRNEEKAFLNDFSSFLGTKAILALEEINQILGLDYCGIDFGMDKNGNILLYEANSSMRINQLTNDKRWDYRRAAIENALAATKRMFIERVSAPDSYPTHP
jgi:tetratricopeptide (TPR) repeat protein/glutathione synthase/RimK-type ligase-like ATP-grasp enzyme